MASAAAGAEADEWLCAQLRAILGAGAKAHELRTPKGTCRKPSSHGTATHAPRANHTLIHTPSVHSTLCARYEQVTRPLMSSLMVQGGRQQFYLEEQEAHGRSRSVKLHSL